MPPWGLDLNKEIKKIMKKLKKNKLFKVKGKGFYRLSKAQQIYLLHHRLDTMPLSCFSVSNLKAKYPDIFIELDKKSEWYIEDPKWKELDK